MRCFQTTLSMTSNLSEEDDFMTGPLVIWLQSCLENPGCLNEFQDLVDGVLIYQVLLQIDPEPTFSGVVSSLGNPQICIRNLDIILKNIRVLYQEELGQMIILSPDIVRLVKQRSTTTAHQDMNLLLLLLLACAVQCPNKEIFIDKIKNLDVEVQHSLVECIKQVTDTQLMVLGNDAVDSASPDILLNHVRQLVKERDKYQQCLANSISSESSVSSETKRRQSSTVSNSESHHLAVELADWKSKLRKQRQELEEKTEALTECKEELEVQRLMVSKLRQEISEVVQEARSAKAYRDELDAMREKAERAERLELEVQRFKDKLSDIEFYKTRIQELREDNRVLLETREMVEDQLQRARRRGDHVLELEAEILLLKQHTNELTLERDAKDKKLEELYEQHAELQVLTRSALQDASFSKVDSDTEEPLSSGSASLSEQLTHNATARALRLELENRKLLSTIENLRETSFHEAGNRILELEKENKKFSLTVEQLEETSKRLTDQNKELETIIEESLQENRKLQESKETLRATLDKQQQELQRDRGHIEHLNNEIDKLNRETERLKSSVKQLENCKSDLEVWKEGAAQVPELQQQLAQSEERAQTSEKEVDTLSKEVLRLKEIIEDKDVNLDQYISEAAAYKKEYEQLHSELTTAQTQVTRLHELEREREEMTTHAAMTQETLTALQAELVAEKVNSQQIKSAIEKFGFKSEIILDPDTTVDTLFAIPEVKEVFIRCVSPHCPKCKNEKKDYEKVNSDKLCKENEELKNELTSVHGTADSLQSENVNLQVVVAMLQSQITSLSSQHTALQLANSQLVAEKDELAKQNSQQKTTHEQLVVDQVALQALHEQLSIEHESVLRERETLKQSQRDNVKEIRGLRDLVSKLEANCVTLKQEKETLIADTQSLSNLRGEHSKLKDDFRNLFTASEKVKVEYRVIQDEYKTLRAESSTLQLRHTELQGEAATMSDQATHLQIQLSKIANQNEMLLQMNSNLEEDRRSLMEHVSRLLSQYHELLTHSLEDKQHYHSEEKMFADKVNNLSRQKEKLEEKIMDHYRKLESCSTKKKGFGASLVRRVRKAGTELINKSRRSWHEDARRTSMTFQGSESGGNESDGSLDELRHDESNPRALGFPQSLNQQEPGTRRGMYYGPGIPEDTNKLDESEETQDDSKPATFLVYNRISNTVVNNVGDSVGVHGPAPPSPSHSVRSQKSLSSLPTLSPSEEARRKAKKENPIWYEYGCV